MLFLSYYCLCLLFNKIGEFCLKARRGGGERERERVGEEAGVRGRNGPNNVCTYE
jgi:hypothetical protein